MKKIRAMERLKKSKFAISQSQWYIYYKKENGQQSRWKGGIKTGERHERLDLILFNGLLYIWVENGGSEARKKDEIDLVDVSDGIQKGMVEGEDMKLMRLI